MKTKIPLIGRYLIVVLLACVGIIYTCSCNELPWKKDVQNTDSVSVKPTSDPQILTFDNVEAVLEYQAGEIKALQEDSFIVTIPEEHLRAVATVLFKRKDTVTIQTLYNEYANNKQIYDNLPYTAPINYTDIVTQHSQTATEEQHKPDSNATKKEVTTFRDTIINGKKYQIETKLSAYE